MQMRADISVPVQRVVVVHHFLKDEPMSVAALARKTGLSVYLVNKILRRNESLFMQDGIVNGAPVWRRRN